MSEAAPHEGGTLSGAVVTRAIEGLLGAVSAEASAALSRFSELVSENARRYSLVSRAVQGELGVHLVDSAALLAALRADQSDSWDELADLGSGAGLPAVVIAILRRDARVVAVDSRNSRVVFLKQVRRELGLGNLEILHERLETLAGRRAFDLAVSRALGRVSDTLAASLRVVAPRGRLVLFKGPRWEQEAQQATRIAGEHGCELGWVRKVELPEYGRTSWFVEFHVKQSGAGS